MIDSDLAEMYGVKTKHLKRQVRSNLQRFPKEFMFQLTKEEWSELVPIWHHPCEGVAFCDSKSSISSIVLTLYKGNQARLDYS